MSTILQLQTQIREVGEAIAHHERAMIDNPSPSVEASLRSLSRRLDRLQAAFASHAAGVGIDVCKYRFFSDFVRPTAKAVGQALVEFQAVFTHAYNAIQHGPRLTTRVTTDIEQATAFGVGYTYPGSLGIVLTFSNEQLELFPAMDEAMAAVFELAKAKSVAELAKQGKRLGPPTMKAVYRWASAHAVHGLGADVSWNHGGMQKNRLVMDGHALGHLVGILQNTTHNEIEEIVVEGMFAGGEHVAKHAFHFIADDGSDFRGKYTDAISEENPVLWPKRYRAYLKKTTKIFFASEKEDQPSYMLIRLEPL